MRPTAILILSALLSACGSSEPETPPTVAPAVAAPVVAAPAEAPPAPAPAAAPAAPGTTVASIYEGWSATDARIGTEVTIAGTFGNAMRVGGELQSVSVAVSPDEMRSIFCEFDAGTAPAAVTLTSWHDPITVRGTLADDHGRPSLQHCVIVP